MKPVRFSGHARDNMSRRGAAEEEVIRAIRAAPWRPAERGRHECQKDFAFDRTWNGKRYATKRVRPIFADEPEEIVVVTVYVYYF